MEGSYRILLIVLLASGCGTPPDKKAAPTYTVTTRIEEGGLQIYIRNRDEAAPRAATLVLRLMDFSGRQFWEREIAVTVRGGEDTRLNKSYRVTELLNRHDEKKTLLLLRLKDGEQVLGEYIHFFVPPESLALSDPKLEIRVKGHQEGYRILLRPVSLARDVYLEFPGVEGTFSRNHFDLLAGESLSVLFRTRYEVDEESLLVRTAWDITTKGRNTSEK